MQKKQGGQKRGRNNRKKIIWEDVYTEDRDNFSGVSSPSQQGIKN